MGLAGSGPGAEWQRLRLRTDSENAEVRRRLGAIEEDSCQQVHLMATSQGLMRSPGHFYTQAWLLAQLWSKCLEWQWRMLAAERNSLWASPGLSPVCRMQCHGILAWCLELAGPPVISQSAWWIQARNQVRRHWQRLCCWHTVRHSAIVRPASAPCASRHILHGFRTNLQI